MVDLARVVQVVLDHDGDYPARLFHLVLVGPARPQELLIVEGRDVLAQPAVSLAQPGDDIGDRWLVVEDGLALQVLHPVPQVAGRVVPGHRGVTERVVVVPVLAGGDVGGEEADRPGAAGGRPEPVVGGDGAQVAQQRVPLALIEGHVHQVEQLLDGGAAHAATGGTCRR